MLPLVSCCLKHSDENKCCLSWQYGRLIAAWLASWGTFVYDQLYMGYWKKFLISKPQTLSQGAHSLVIAFICDRDVSKKELWFFLSLISPVMCVLMETKENETGEDWERCYQGRLREKCASEEELEEKGGWGSLLNPELELLILGESHSHSEPQFPFV